MKITREIMIEAHELAREIKNEYPSVDYKTQVGINISYLLNNRESENMVSLKEIKEFAINEGVEKINLWGTGDIQRIYIKIKKLSDATNRQNYLEIKENKIVDYSCKDTEVVGKIFNKFKGQTIKEYVEENNKLEQLKKSYYEKDLEVDDISLFANRFKVENIKFITNNSVYEIKKVDSMYSSIYKNNELIEKEVMIDMLDFCDTYQELENKKIRLVK